MNYLSISNVSPLIKGLCIVLVMGLFTACQNNVGQDAEEPELTIMDVPSPLALEQQSSSDVFTEWTSSSRGNYVTNFENTSSDGFIASYYRETNPAQSSSSFSTSATYTTTVLKDGVVNLRYEFSGINKPINISGQSVLIYFIKPAGKKTKYIQGIIVLTKENEFTLSGTMEFDLNAGDTFHLRSNSTLGILDNNTEASIEGMVVISVVNDPETKQDCKKGGYGDYGFKNQGQCVRFVETGKDSR